MCVTRVEVEAYLDTKGKVAITIKWKEGGRDPSCLFRFEKTYEPKYRGMYIMKTLLDAKCGKIVSGHGIVQTTNVRTGRDYCITSNHRTFGCPIIFTVTNSQCNIVH